MSVLMEFAMFPTDKGESVSDPVSKVIEMIKNEGVPYKLTAMGTIVETETMEEALAIVQKSHDVLAKDANRIYSTIKFDVRKNKSNRLEGKIKSIEDQIGSVEH
ncbi:MAG: MTH1187 family thiamine-binding protein [Bacteroidales bacterium]